MRHLSNEFQCEICHINYIGVMPPDIMPLENALPQMDTLFPICCSCEWFEFSAYITGTIFGLGAIFIYQQPVYSYNKDVQIAFGIFAGLFMGLYSIAIVSTCERYYQLFNAGRTVHDI